MSPSLPETGSAAPPEGAVRVYTVGHSNRSREDFTGLLHEFDIATLADIRRFPGSRKYPHFGRDAMQEWLPAAGVAYLWIPALGGRRHKADPASPNAGLRNQSFRNYADYMSTPEFEEGIASLLEVAGRTPTAMMCAELLYWSCHRRLVSDYLTGRGVEVLHILKPGDLRPHPLTPGAVIDADGRVSYPPTGMLFG